MLRTLIVIVFLAFYVLLVGPLFILHCVLTGSVERLYRAGVAGAAFALRLGGVRLRVSGLENIPPGVCVFVGNHSSNVDPPAVVAAIPRRVALLAKKEVFRVPILRRALVLGSFVPVDRSNRSAAIASVEQAMRYLRAGISYLVFPEGTRSPDGRLRPFKKGSFVMAIRAAVPIVPVAVVGAHRRIRKGEMTLRPGIVDVRFLPPIDAAGYSLETREELLVRVHAAIAAALPEDQKPLESTVGPEAAGD